MPSLGVTLDTTGPSVAGGAARIVELDSTRRTMHPAGSEHDHGIGEVHDRGRRELEPVPNVENLGEGDRHLLSSPRRAGHSQRLKPAVTTGPPRTPAVLTPCG
jgi:hypothetical protein